LYVSFEKIEEFSTNFVEFYTVRIDDDQLTEFEIFDGKDFPDHYQELEIMYNAIDIMQKEGAHKAFFAFEGPANAMPVVTKVIKYSNKTDFGLRLYCIRLTDSLVVLLNGDIKTKRNPVECANVSPHFTNALRIATALDKMIFQKEITLQKPNSLTDLEIEI